MNNFPNLNFFAFLTCLCIISCDEIEEVPSCELSFSSTLDLNENASAVTGTFESTTLSSTEDVKYYWSIDDVVIEAGNSQRLETSFAANGIFTICVFAETPECPEGVTHCEEVTIEGIKIEEVAPCANFDITVETISDDGKTYFFRATESTNVPYTWYVDDEEIIFDASYHPTDTVALTHEFAESGIYSVCAKSLVCQEVITSCIDVVIETDVIDCAAIDIESNVVNEDGSSVNFYINDNLPGAYRWKVNGQVVFEPTATNKGSEFFYEFPEAGTYTICAKDTSAYCENAIEKCVEVFFEGEDDGVEAGFSIEVNTIEQTKSEEDCLDLSYNHSVSAINPDSYILEATEFPNITDDFYGWFVNGDFTTAGRVFEREFVATGTYTICVFIETPDCPMGVKFCKDFVVN